MLPFYLKILLLNYFSYPFLWRHQWYGPLGSLFVIIFALISDWSVPVCQYRIFDAPSDLFSSWLVLSPGMSSCSWCKICFQNASVVSSLCSSPGFDYTYTVQSFLVGPYLNVFDHIFPLKYFMHFKTLHKYTDASCVSY